MPISVIKAITKVELAKLVINEFGRIKTLTELLALRNKIIERNQLLIDIQVGSIKPATTTTQ